MVKATSARKSVVRQQTFQYPNPNNEINLADLIDVDSGAREVPVNMLFKAEGFLTKDTGVDYFGDLGNSLVTSLFTYEKKDGTVFEIKAEGKFLMRYDSPSNMYMPLQPWIVGTGTVEIVTGSPLIVGTGTSFTGQVSVDTHIQIGTEVFIVTNVTDDTHLTVDHNVTQVSNTGLAFNRDTTPTFTAGGYFGFVVYNDILYGGNAIDSFFSFDGTTLTFFPSLPKGNIFEVFEDRIFVSGVAAEPLSTYYSDTATPTTFNGASVLKPLGTDKMTGLLNYYGTLIMLKRKSLWKMTFIYDQVAQAFLPKLDVFNRSYGCVGPRAYTWVENDVWFFTGNEVKAFGIQNQQTGNLGLDPSALSNDIKDTLDSLNASAVVKACAFYQDRRFYLAVPVGASTFNDTVFVCNLLYKNAWTKMKNRVKASVSHFSTDSTGTIVRSASADVLGRVYAWDPDSYNDAGTAISAYVNFKEISYKDFSQVSIWRYLDVKFASSEGTMGVNLWSDAYDIRSSKAKSFYLSNAIEGEDNPLGEVDFGEHLWGDAFGETVSAETSLLDACPS